VNRLLPVAKHTSEAWPVKRGCCRDDDDDNDDGSVVVDDGSDGVGGGGYSDFTTIVWVDSSLIG
jgi:hypothetical protein